MGDGYIPYWSEGGHLMPPRRYGRAMHRAIVKHRNRLADRRLWDFMASLARDERFDAFGSF